jgi:hypothetical protein
MSGATVAYTMSVSSSCIEEVGVGMASERLTQQYHASYGKCYAVECACGPIVIAYII